MTACVNLAGNTVLGNLSHVAWMMKGDILRSHLPSEEHFWVCGALSLSWGELGTSSSCSSLFIEEAG